MKELKKIMTDLAAGHIDKKEADRLTNLLKTPQNKPVGQIKRGNAHKRKKSIKAGGKIK